MFPKAFVPLIFVVALFPLRALSQEAGTAPEMDSEPAAAAPVKPGSVLPPSGGAYRVGGDVKAPVLMHSVQPKYTKSARKLRLNGAVTVALVVDENGLPQKVYVKKGTGTELDDIALAAVRQYTFKPAMRASKPVPVELFVAVNFQIMPGDDAE